MSACLTAKDFDQERLILFDALIQEGNIGLINAV